MSKLTAQCGNTLVAISLLNLQIGDFMDTQKAIHVLKNLTDVFAGSYVCDALRMSIKSLETKELAQQPTNSKSMPCCDVCGGPLRSDGDCASRIAHLYGE